MGWGASAGDFGRLTGWIRAIGNFDRVRITRIMEIVQIGAAFEKFMDSASEDKSVLASVL